MSVVTKNPFSLRPKCYINNEELEIVENMDYFGAKLGNCGAKRRILQRWAKYGNCYTFLNLPVRYCVLLTHDI